MASIKYRDSTGISAPTPTQGLLGITLTRRQRCGQPNQAPHVRAPSVREGRLLPGSDEDREQGSLAVTLGGIEPTVSWVRTRLPTVSRQRRETPHQLQIDEARRDYSASSRPGIAARFRHSSQVLCSR
jgi:hypothetical protein